MPNVSIKYFLKNLSDLYFGQSNPELCSHPLLQPAAARKLSEAILPGWGHWAV